jgi:hypothetical protein
MFTTREITLLIATEIRADKQTLLSGKLEGEEPFAA